ncbi:MAG TPA: DNA polymerase III subunit delta [Armatimonadota bacterium]
MPVDAPREAVKPLVLLHGSDDASKRERLKALLKKLVDPDFSTFDLVRLDARSQPMAQVLNRLATAPIASARQTVVLLGPERLRPKELEALLKAVPSLPESGCLILVTEESGSDRGESLPVKLMNAAKKHGLVEEFRVMNQGQAQAFVVLRARQMGLALSPPVARQLVFQAGTLRGSLESEMEKLAAYADGREVTAADVEAVAAASPEANVFQLVDAVGARDAAAALGALDTLLSKGEKPFALFAMILRQLRLVWQVKLLQEKRMLRVSFLQLPEEVTALLPRDPYLGRLDWQKEKLAGQASRFTWSQLVESFSRVLQADLILKGVQDGPQDAQMLMESLVLGLCRGGGLVQPLRQA